MRSSLRSARRHPTTEDAPESAPPPERVRHDRLVPDERFTSPNAGGRPVRTVGLRVVSQTPLDRYHQQGHIDESQWAAGDRLRRDFEMGAFEMLARPRWDGMPGGGLKDPAAIPLAACAARKAYVQALARLPRRVTQAVVHVCCHRGYAADWARARDLPKTDGMALLRLGLDLLASHYGIAGPTRKSPIGENTLDTAPRGS
jgi:hypothetical protein